MLVESNFLDELEQSAYSPTGEPMCVYGDPAYPLRVHLQAPFRQGRLTPMMEAYNAEMSSVRVSVEWLFGDIINDFKFLDFKKNLKIGMSSVGKMYLVCALLNNALTCLYGNKTSEYFGLGPPSLEDYFRNWNSCKVWQVCSLLITVSNWHDEQFVIRSYSTECCYCNWCISLIVYTSKKTGIKEEIRSGQRVIFMRISISCQKWLPCRHVLCSTMHWRVCMVTRLQNISMSTHPHFLIISPMHAQSLRI